MRFTPKKAVATAGVVMLTACSGGDPLLSDWFQPIGTNTDEGYFGAPTAINSALQTGEISAIDSLGLRFENEVDPTITFAFNSSVLDSGARATLKRQAQWIRQFPEVRFRVYGHTDAVGPDSYNNRLGLRRANAAVRYLSSQGIDRSRLEAVVSRGESELVVASQGQERRNRRTVTEVTGFVSTSSTHLEGKYAEVIYREFVDGAAAASTLTSLTTGLGSEGSN